MGLQQPPSFQPGDLLPQLRCSPAPAGSFNPTHAVLAILKKLEISKPKTILNVA
jgi:hypothetical protein